MVVKTLYFAWGDETPWRLLWLSVDVRRMFLFRVFNQRLGKPFACINFQCTAEQNFNYEFCCFSKPAEDPVGRFKRIHTVSSIQTVDTGLVLLRPLIQMMLRYRPAFLYLGGIILVPLISCFYRALSLTLTCLLSSPSNSNYAEEILG